SRALQLERTDLQAAIKKLSKPGTIDSTSSSALTTVSSSTLPVEDNPSTRATVLSTADVPTSSDTGINGHDASKTESDLGTTSDLNAPATVEPESPNLYDSELGRIANTVD
ncbi:unnamed protein product, partial [Rotaria magnacalcarata]